MRMTVNHADGRVPVTILELHGALDASNYEAVITKARELYNAGTRHLLLDMSAVPFMGSSGLVALHSIALLMRDAEQPDLEQGWHAFHAIERDRDNGISRQVKLLNPQAKAVRTLEMTGMIAFFEIYHDRESAIQSFN